NHSLKQRYFMVVLEYISHEKPYRVTFCSVHFHLYGSQFCILPDFAEKEHQVKKHGGDKNDIGYLIPSNKGRIDDQYRQVQPEFLRAGIIKNAHEPPIAAKHWYQG